jgi:hypothetical protein
MLSVPQKLRRVFWDLSLATCLLFFSLPALAPLFSVSPTRSADGLLHLYRLVELAQLWRQGIFFSRWLPDLAYGYGLPLLNYYAPLVYYLTAPLHLVGISFTLALNISLALALLTGAFGMFFFTRELLSVIKKPSLSARPDFSRLSNIAALTAALAYLYTPYILFNAFDRANLAEQWALGFAPWTLWSFTRLSRVPNSEHWLLASLSFASVLLSHNVTGFLFAPLLLGFILIQPANQQVPKPPSKNRILRALGGRWFIPLSAFGIALALAAFFWLPALAERDWVQIARVIVTPDFDYHFNFLRVDELIALLPRADTGRLNSAFPATLGVVQVLLAAFGIIFLISGVLRTRRLRTTLPLLYLLAASLVFIALMLPFSVGVWDRVSLLAFVQLPTRLRGLVALTLAPLAGLPVYYISAWWQRGGMLVAGASIITLVLSAVPMLYPRYARDVPPNPTLADMFAYEQRTGALGTTSFGEYLPVWVTDAPDHSPLVEAYARGNALPDRFVLPEGVKICGGGTYPLAQLLCAYSPVEWRAVFRAFYFPGWRAWLDGQPVTLTPTARDGLISFDVPSGEPLLVVAYGDTPVETGANIISGAAFVIVLGLAAFGFWRLPRQVIALRAASSFVARRAPPFALYVLALLLLAAKVFYLDHFDSPLVTHYDGGRVEGIADPRQVNFGDQLQLLGFDLNSHTLRAGDNLSVTLYWRAEKKLEKNWSVFVHLTAADGRVLTQKDNLHPANLPTSQWDADAYTADLHAFTLPSDLTRGEYELRAGVYDPKTRIRLKTDTGADYYLLAKIMVDK